MLATPAEVSAELAPKLLAKGSRVIDLSGAFRLEDAAAGTARSGSEEGRLELTGRLLGRARERRHQRERSCFRLLQREMGLVGIEGCSTW